MAGKINDFFQGDTKKLKLKFTDANGSPVNIAGWQFVITFKTEEKLDLPDAQANLQVSYTVPNDSFAALGEYTLTLTSTSTKTLAPATYFYDIERRILTETPVDVLTIVSDKVKVKKGVTNGD